MRCAHAVLRPDDDIGNDVERAGFSGDRIGREGLEHAQRLVENGGLAVGELEKRRTLSAATLSRCLETMRLRVQARRHAMMEGSMRSICFMRASTGPAVPMPGGSML